MADLKLIQLVDISVPAGEVCGPEGCGPDCCGGAHAGVEHDHAHGGLEHSADFPAATATYRVDGMSCAHCVQSVTRELTKIEGVDAVDIRLVPDGVSLVTVGSDAPIGEDAIRAAIEEAGYDLV